MKELRKLNHLHIKTSHGLAALKISKKMSQLFEILESPAMKAAREIAQSYSIPESPSMKAAREIAQSFAIPESPAMKAAREIAQSFAIPESPAMKAARKIVQSFAIPESPAMKAAREIVQSFAIPESPTMKAAREIVQSFAIPESPAMKAAREMTLLFAAQDLSVITEQINKLLSESSDSVEIKDDSVEQTFVKLAQVTSSNSNEGFLSWYDNQPSSIQLIVTLFLSYFLNVFSNLSMPLYKNWEYLFERETPRVATKLISQSANKEYDIYELSNYRFVLVSVLNVRAEPSTKAEVVDELKNGMVVKFVSKSKRWTQIEFICDETGERKIGWVFSRYLRKFELKSHI
ncbi:SH3 domain-containing protein [Aeromonas veronii]|uniref:SH3 domain-containing protein n=1 Tax=Aeromonas veronii TaxID=654 RepID=UPI003D1DB519